MRGELVKRRKEIKMMARDGKERFNENANKMVTRYGNVQEGLKKSPRTFKSIIDLYHYRRNQPVIHENQHNLFLILYLQ